MAQDLTVSAVPNEMTGARRPAIGFSAASAGAGAQLRRGLADIGAFLGPVILFAVLAFAVLAASRGFLAWSNASRIATMAGLGEVFHRGVRFDVVVVGAVCSVALLVKWLAPSSWLRHPWWPRLLTAWLAAWLMLIVWNEAATPDFVAEFGVRPNRLYLEYLDSPREVFATLWLAHRPALVAGVVMAIVAGGVSVLLLHRPCLPVPSLGVRVLALAPVVALAAFGARGSVGHRPLNVSFASFGTDALVNDLALNSTYSAVHALVAMARERRVLTAYQELPRVEVIRRNKVAMQLPAAAFADPLLPLAHRVGPASSPARPPDLVVLIQESLGAHYVASLGGDPVATRMDSWRNRSFWFDRLYATGTRSARGLEAIVTGFPPTRAASVLKLEGAQRGFFTLASVLREQGYETRFIYGGDSSFDNMRRFFLGNGFDEVIDWTDFPAGAGFRTTWGVSDEDLYARVHSELAARDGSDKPRFTLVFSTSNHPPYEYPAGRIVPYDAAPATPANAARYADFAVGSYLDTARRSAYWDRTVFLVVADHASRVVGSGLVPVPSFHVPGFFAGGPIQPRIVGRIASQLDLLPTTLSLLGIAATIPSTGIDQTRTDLSGPGHALMQFHDTAAYRNGDDVVILQPGQAPVHFGLAGQRLVPRARNVELERDAIALTQWPVLAYREGFYR